VLVVVQLDLDAELVVHGAEATKAPFWRWLAVRLLPRKTRV
jgi:hypothetical protein